MSTPTSIPTPPTPPRPGPRLGSGRGPSVAGFCPMGCGEKLILSAGLVVCSALDCPRPLAVTELLGDPETDHLVYLEAADYLIVHPLHERLGGVLRQCHLQRRFARMDVAPLPPGSYRAYLRPGEDEIDWDPLPVSPDTGARGGRGGAGGGGR